MIEEKEGLKILDEALEIARSIEDDSKCSSALANVAEVFADTGRLDEALEIARSIEDKYERSSALVKIATRAFFSFSIVEPEDNASLVPPVKFRVRVMRCQKPLSNARITLYIGDKRNIIPTDSNGYAELNWSPSINQPIRLKWWAEIGETRSEKRVLMLLPFIPPPPEILEIEEKIEKVKSFLRRLENE